MVTINVLTCVLLLHSVEEKKSICPLDDFNFFVKVLFKKKKKKIAPSSVLCIDMFLASLLFRWSRRSSAFSSGQGAWHCCDPAGSIWCSPQWKTTRTARPLRHQRQAHRQCCASDLCKLKTAPDLCSVLTTFCPT